METLSMKLTLGFSDHLAHKHSDLDTKINTPTRTTIKYFLNSNPDNNPDKFCAKQWQSAYLASWGYWSTPYKNTSKLSSLVIIKKFHLLQNYPHTPGLVSIPILNTPPTSSIQALSSRHSNSLDTWFFCSATQGLCNSSICIQLTSIESLIIKTLTRHDARICSKQELILGINKDPLSYSGLEMCLSRLQNKFRSTFGERLFRSVRNRGYCLVQYVQAID